jgi:hypothetical protein
LISRENGPKRIEGQIPSKSKNIYIVSANAPPFV